MSSDVPCLPMAQKQKMIREIEKLQSVLIVRSDVEYGLGCVSGLGSKIVECSSNVGCQLQKFATNMREYNTTYKHACCIQRNSLLFEYFKSSLHSQLLIFGSQTPKYGCVYRVSAFV
jgi:hypothetical protein